MDLLKNRGLEPQIIEYLSNPPTTLELHRLLDMLAMQPRDFIRKKEAIYRDHLLDDDTLSDDALIQAMVDNPILIERPIVVSNGRAVRVWFASGPCILTPLQHLRCERRIFR